MGELMKDLDKFLAQSESNRSKADTTGEQRENFLLALIEKAKKDNVLVMLFGDRSSGKTMEIKPSGLIFWGEGVRTMVIPHKEAPFLAHLKVDTNSINSIAYILDKVLRGEMGITFRPIG